MKIAFDVDVLAKQMDICLLYTSHPKAGVLDSNPICFNVCCAAPSAGVFVVAPQSMPTISGRDTPNP